VQELLAKGHRKLQGKPEIAGFSFYAWAILARMKK